MDRKIFIFSIEGVCLGQDGVVVVGRVRNGELKQGDVVHLVSRFREAKKVVCEHLLKNDREIVRARKSEALSIVLSGVEMTEVEKGMLLSTPDYRVRID